MNFEYYLEKLWYKILYLIVVIVYLVNLNKLNQELQSQNISNAIKIVEYNNYAALKFFGVAVILILIGIYILCKEISDMRVGRDWDAGLDDFKDIIISIFTIALVIGLIILILKYIMIPILRAILTCAAIALGVGYAMTH